LVPLFWVLYSYPSKIIEMGKELALWPKLNKNIAVRGMLERGRAGVGVCGKTLSHCLGDDWDNEKII
jgi:hypothetical protein